MAGLIESPRSLISLLGVRDMGELPRELAGVIAPVIDITQNYLFARREALNGSGIAAAIGFTPLAASIVPPGEAWYLHAYQLGGTCAVGETLDLYPALRIGGGGVATGPAQAIAASTSRVCPSFELPTRWLAPGDGLAAQVTSLTGAPTVSFTMVFTRLRFA